MHGSQIRCGGMVWSVTSVWISVNICFSECTTSSTIIVNTKLMKNHLTAKQLTKYSFELVVKDAVDDEVDRAVDGDEKIGGLGERVEHLTSHLVWITLKI